MLHYFLEIFAPRRLDPTESTPLTPIAGAPHAEPFRVTTCPDLSGWQPLLDRVDGQTGRWDPLTKVVETGEYTFRVVDRRLGDGNAMRWVTAFLGDTGGTPRPVGCRVALSRSEDGGTTRTLQWSGLVTGFSLDGSRLAYRITTRDLSQRLAADAFDQSPWLGPVPGGAIDDVMDLFTFAPVLLPARPPMPAAGMSDRRLELRVAAIVQDRAVVEVVGDREAADNLVTRALLTGVQLSVRVETAIGLARVAAWGTQDRDGLSPQLEVWTGPNGGARSARYQVVAIDAVGRERGSRKAPDVALRVATMTIAVSPASEPLFAALPTVGATLHAIVVPGRAGAASKDMPIVLRDVPVLRLMRWIAEGRFSRRLTTVSGSRLAGVPCDLAAFAAAESSFDRRPAINVLIDGTKPIREALEALICRPYNLAYAFNSAGQLYPIETRFSGRVGSGGSPFVATLTDDDVDTSDIPTWSVSSSDAIPGVEVKYRVLTQTAGQDERLDTFALVPAGALGAVVATTRSLIVLFGRYGETGTQLHVIDAPGLGYFTTPQLASDAAQLAVGSLDTAAAERDVQREARATAESYRQPFGSGVTMLRLSYRRTAAALAVQPGSFALIQHDVIPNLSTNLRGGSRVVQCVSATDRGARIAIEWLDLAADVVPDPPAALSATLDSSERTAPTLSITTAPNAAGHSVFVSLCATSTAESVRPADTDPRWTFCDRVPTASTSLFSVEPGRRHWLRAASVATSETGPTRWSGYRYAVAPIDVPPLLAPSALTRSALTSRRAVHTWTLTAGMERALVDVLAEVYDADPGSTPAVPMIHTTLSPGATSAELFLEPGRWYVVGVRYRTPTQYVGPPVLAAAFLAAGVAPQAPACTLGVRAVRG
jgi:hypothetical protein